MRPLWKRPRQSWKSTVSATRSRSFLLTGTLISTIATNSSARDLLAPLILLPLLIPLVIAAAGAAEPVLSAGGPEYDRFGTWLAVLGLYDGVFALVGYAVFDFLLED